MCQLKDCKEWSNIQSLMDKPLTKSYRCPSCFLWMDNNAYCKAPIPQKAYAAIYRQRHAFQLLEQGALARASQMPDLILKRWQLLCNSPLPCTKPHPEAPPQQDYRIAALSQLLSVDHLLRYTQIRQRGMCPPAKPPLRKSGYLECCGSISKRVLSQSSHMSR